MEADTGEKAYPGIWGLTDDILYLAPVVWLDWHLFRLSAAVGAPTFALFTWYNGGRWIVKRPVYLYCAYQSNQHSRYMRR